MTRILMVTDQPFWRRQTGAQQRIWSLTQFLSDEGFELTIFYMVERNRRDRDQVDDLCCRFVDYEPRPGAFPDLISPIFRAAKWVWQRVFGERRRAITEPKSLSSGDGDDAPMRLADFRWPHASRQFTALVARFRPDVVLMEYVIWSHLLERFPKGERPFRAAVDTHDALHRRCAQFGDHAQAHWIEITRQEEARALQQFDLIISIQPDEAELFREMAPGTQVMVVGHVPWVPREHVRGGNASMGEGVIRVGYIGSANAANIDALEWFFDACWGELVESTVQPLELVIGGPIQKQFADRNIAYREKVRFLGEVTDLVHFYDPLDIVINPVRYGSGLKIKSVESFCFGKPLVAHPHSLVGLSPAAHQAALSAADPAEFVDACRRLIDDGDFRAQVVRHTLQVGRSEYSAQTVYAEFSDWLKHGDQGPA